MIALITGSFDPITKGHVDIINKTINIFGVDNVKIAVMNNLEKDHLLNLSDRVCLIEACFSSDISVTVRDGMISDIINEGYEEICIVRGLRNSVDFEYEKTVEAFTKEFGASTIYITPEPENVNISSSLVRNIIKAEGNYDKFMANSAVAKLLKAFIGAPEWISVDEMLPETDDIYEVRIQQMPDLFEETKRKFKGGLWWGGIRPFSDNDHITHWLKEL